ncbi:MAG: saccharopine dehydrogenase NADP-binding domain-containing protein, partial [Gammaproteobacteria bacterium]
MTERDYDLVLYGASGFTGKQAVKYFAQHAQELRWAIAGRNREKLEAMRAQIGAPASMVAVLVAESGDQAAVDAIVSRTRVMLSTAGPPGLSRSMAVPSSTPACASRPIMSTFPARRAGYG